MVDVKINDLVELYNLEPHPEGGFYKETFRDDKSIPASSLPEHGGDRSYSTGIYFLLTKGMISSLHRIKSDEMWHFYLGGPLTVVQISPNGDVEEIVLGQGVKSGQKVQHVVPAGYWFGAYPNEGSEYSFVGCTVAPGFDFRDFEMGNRENLIKQFPNAKDIIEKLTNI